MKFLVFAPESPALQGAATSEAALRTSGLVEGLRAHGHTVEVSGSRGGLDPTSRVHAVKPEPQQIAENARREMVVEFGKGGPVTLRGLVIPCFLAR